MKKILLFLFFILVLGSTKAQTNLVLNPSFEDTVSCPSAANQIDASANWNASSGSPDYMNVCCTDGLVGVPLNFGGYQQAASGYSYSAFATYVSLISNYRECIGGMLSSSLLIGVKYFVSFKVALSIDSSNSPNCASNKMGAMFSTVLYNAASSPAPITNNPQVYSNSIITDTLNWTRIKGSFISDSSYNYIILGNFFDDSHTNTLPITSGSGYTAYYYCDDICVSTDSAYTYNYSYTGIKEENKQPDISIYPNPATDFINIVFAYLNEPYTIKIFDVLGREIFFKEKIINNNETISIADIKSNVLFVKILYQNKQYNYKLIKI